MGPEGTVLADHVYELCLAGLHDACPGVNRLDGRRPACACPHHTAPRPRRQR